MKYVTWDTETTITPHLKRKASPFTSANWVVTHAYKRAGDAGVTEVRFGRSRPPSGWLAPVLEGSKLVIGMNIKFDLLHALQDAENLRLWMAFIASGGQVWDIQLAEYLLCGMGTEDQMLALDEIAPRYGGGVKIDEVKALWKAGINTHDIEPALLSRYLCGGLDEHGVWQPGDVENTERVALAQIARARAAGQMRSILLNMGSLVCTVEMERNGMRIDVERGKLIAQDLEARRLALRTKLDSFLPTDLPFSFNWGSAKQKSALIFGGEVPYETQEYVLRSGGGVRKSYFDSLPEDARPHLDYVQEDVRCVQPVTMPPELAACALDAGWVPEAFAVGHEVVRYKSGKNAGEPKTKMMKQDCLTKPKSRKVTAHYSFSGFTKPMSRWETSVPGVWSVSSDVIEALASRKIPFLDVMSDLQALTKDLGTYFIVTDPRSGETSGMLALVDPRDDCIHHSLNHTATVTGRFSSSSPNLQNIPKGKKSRVKEVFTSRFPGGGIIQSDFSALEIYVQAILTKCPNLIADLQAGLDMHCMRLANTEGVPYEQVLRLCKGDPEAGVPADSEWDYKRTEAKVYSFQAAYGAGDAKIAETTGMSPERVAALREVDEKRYPEIKKYFDDRTVEIKLGRKPTGLSVPHPLAPGIFCHLGKSVVSTPDGKRYTYKETPSPEYLIKRGIFASFSPTEIKNYEVQGTGGEWAKAAMWLAVRAFYARGNFGGGALLVNQCHDALWMDAAPGVAKQAAGLLHACMECASDLIEHIFSWHVPVPIPTDTSMGDSMIDDKPIPGVQAVADSYKQSLRDSYLGGYIPSFNKGTSHDS